jgi:hypothetical protein
VRSAAKAANNTAGKETAAVKEKAPQQDTPDKESTQ